MHWTDVHECKGAQRVSSGRGVMASEDEKLQVHVVDQSGQLQINNVQPP